MYVGLWSRLRDFERPALTRALERRSVVQATLLRSTIHLVSRRDFWAWAVAIRPARREHWLRGAPAAPRDVEMTALARQASSALDGGALRRTEIAALIGTRATQAINLWLNLVRAPPSGHLGAAPGRPLRRRRGLARAGAGRARRGRRARAARAPLPGGVRPGDAQGRGELGRAEAGRARSGVRGDEAPALRVRGRRGADGLAARAAAARRHAGTGALPADVGRDAARPRAPRRDPARGAPPADLQHEDAPVRPDVPRRRG